MVAAGTKRKCAVGDHQVKFNGTTWHHLTKADWIDQPHKASPKKYRKAV